MPYTTTVALVLGYLVVSIIYRLYFDQLSQFPGPKLWAISRIPFAISLLKGDIVKRKEEFHNRYGEVVRVAPDELSFIGEQVWNDVYNNRGGRKPMPKEKKVFYRAAPNGVESIVTANDADHSRIRRLLAHAFSDKALREQEPLLQSYVTQLITGLREVTVGTHDGTATVDIVKWLNWTTFDLVAELSLGESFGCLKEAAYHPWVAMIFGSIKGIGISQSTRYFPWLEKVLLACLPESIKRLEMDHFKMSVEKLHRRLAEGEVDGKVDFISYLLKHNDEKGMSVPEIEATFGPTLLVAGSETTGTILSGIFNYLTRYPSVYQRLVDEVRNNHVDEASLSVDTLVKLPYLNAVIEEGLRLCHPVPSSLPRIVPIGGASICRRWIPQGTIVSIAPFPANRSASNFAHATEFIPERWLRSSGPSIFDNDHKGVSQPFSVGPRNCIGRNLANLEMRLILARLLWNFDISATGADARNWSWEDQKTYVLWEKKDNLVQLKCVAR